MHEWNWQLPVLYIVTFDKKQSVIFQIMYFFPGNSNNKCRYDAFDVVRQIAVYTPQFWRQRGAQ